MKISICNSLKWQFYRNFDFSSGSPVLKDGFEWNKFQSRSKITLSTDSENNDSGTLVKETITCSALSKNCILLKTSLKMVILNVDTNAESVIVGSEEYPVMKTFSDNGTVCTVTFSRQSAL